MDKCLPIISLKQAEPTKAKTPQAGGLMGLLMQWCSLPAKEHVGKSLSVAKRVADAKGKCRSEGCWGFVRDTALRRHKHHARPQPAGQVPSCLCTLTSPSAPMPGRPNRASLPQDRAHIPRPCTSLIWAPKSHAPRPQSLLKVSPMSDTTFSPHLEAVILSKLADREPMTAIARELNITVHMVKKVRDGKSPNSVRRVAIAKGDTRKGRLMTRAEATAQVLKICHEWNNDRLTELENRYAHLGEKIVYERDTKRTSKIPEYKKTPLPTGQKRARHLAGLAKMAKNQI